MYSLFLSRAKRMGYPKTCWLFICLPKPRHRLSGMETSRKPVGLHIYHLLSEEEE